MIKINSDFIQNMDPTHKRWVGIIGGISLFVGLMYLYGGTEESAAKANQRKEVIRNVITDTNTREIGIDALVARVNDLYGDNRRLESNVEKLQQEAADQRRRRGNDPDMGAEVERLAAQVKQMGKANEKLRWTLQDIQDGYISLPEREFEEGGEATEEKGKKEKKESKEERKPRERRVTSTDRKLGAGDPRQYFKQQQKVPGSDNKPRPGTPTESLMEIVTISAAEESVENKEEELSSYLPSGSILTGELLSGLDAPTAKGARRDPFPVVIRILHEAILPNHYSSDVKECFLTMAGYGDLSSERAYLRGETLSCVYESGGVMEVALDSYAVGEDGKAGLRGRLVDKQGQLIARSLMAGVAGGFADALGKSPVPVIQTSPGESSLFQRDFTSDAFEHGMSSGASSALNRIADYYLDLADSIFPVIEIDAGRTVDIVVTRGAKFSVKGSARL